MSNIESTRSTIGERLLFILFVVYVFSIAAYAVELTGNEAGVIESGLKRSDLEVQNCAQLYSLTGERYTCGYLQVPEDYVKNSSPLIRVPFLLIKPEGDLFDATLQPLLITGGGGPGNALLGNRHFPPEDSSFWMYEEFSVVDGRPLLILENRGVGLSQPNLDCHYPPEIYQQQFWSELLESDLRCGLEYAAEGVDLSQYNVHNAALDIEMFRRLSANLGINTSQLNLYGVSYGTRVAMYYERMFPSATRTLVLDSVALNDPDAAADELAYAQQSLDLVFSRCRADADCRKAFGTELEPDFYRFLDSLDESEISLSVHWPDKELPIEVPLSATLVIDILHNALYGSDSFASTPLMIRQLIEGSYGNFISAFNEYVAGYSPKYYFSDTAFITYLCYDVDYSTKNTDTPASRTKVTSLQLSDYWDLESGREYMHDVCSNYGALPGTDLLQQSFSSDTPVLFLSGELDPVTPPASALKATVHYSYHWHITRSNSSHDVISHSPCARFLASWFLYHPEEDLDLRIEECEPEEDLQFLLD